LLVASVIIHIFFDHPRHCRAIVRCPEVPGATLMAFCT
jgi:hypothetical protein